MKYCGPAFPYHEIREAEPSRVSNPKHFPGMSLRDYFAAKAMQGELACQTPDWNNKNQDDKLAEQAYARADAMLEARDKCTS